MGIKDSVEQLLLRMQEATSTENASLRMSQAMVNNDVANVYENIKTNL